MEVDHRCGRSGATSTVTTPVRALFGHKFDSPDDASGRVADDDDAEEGAGGAILINGRSLVDARGANTGGCCGGGCGGDCGCVSAAAARSKLRTYAVVDE